MEINLNRDDIIKEIYENHRNDSDFLFDIVDDTTTSFEPVRELVEKLVKLLESNDQTYCLDINNPSVSSPPYGFDMLKYRIPKDGQLCNCITEIGRKFTARYCKFKMFPSHIGMFIIKDIKDEDCEKGFPPKKDDGYIDKVIYWKYNKTCKKNKNI